MQQAAQFGVLCRQRSLHILLLHKTKHGRQRLMGYEDGICNTTYGKAVCHLPGALRLRMHQLLYVETDGQRVGNHYCLSSYENRSY